MEPERVQSASFQGHSQRRPPEYSVCAAFHARIFESSEGLEIAAACHNDVTASMPTPAGGGCTLRAGPTVALATGGQYDGTNERKEQIRTQQQAARSRQAHPEGPDCSAHRPEGGVHHEGFGDCAHEQKVKAQCSFLSVSVEEGSFSSGPSLAACARASHGRRPTRAPRVACCPARGPSRTGCVREPRQ